MTDVPAQDRARQWLATMIHAADCGCDDKVPDESSADLADAILSIPGVEVTALVRPGLGRGAGHAEQRLAILLPGEAK